MSIKRVLLVACILNLSATFTYSQFTGSPHLSESIQIISEYIASNEFKNLSFGIKSIEAVDSLYVYSMTFCNNNISETLLALTFATLPYYEMPLSIPLIDSKINVDLPAPTKTVFDKKQSNLPENIFYEVSFRSDKDKLAHFFGNAYLSYNANSFNLSRFMSIFVELFEQAFKIEGAVDYRDLIVNSLGNTYGEMLQSNKVKLPSDALKLYNLYHIHHGI